MSFNNSAGNIILRRYSGFIFLKPRNLAVLYSNNGDMQHGAIVAPKNCYFLFTFITERVSTLSPARINSSGLYYLSASGPRRNYTIRGRT